MDFSETEDITRFLGVSEKIEDFIRNNKILCEVYIDKVGNLYIETNKLYNQIKGLDKECYIVLNPDGLIYQKMKQLLPAKAQVIFNKSYKSVVIWIDSHRIDAIIDNYRNYRLFQKETIGINEKQIIVNY